MTRCVGSKNHKPNWFKFLSATEYIPTRTIIQPGWVSSSLSSLLSSSAFSRWDNLRTLWAIKLIFCMDTCYDYVLWIRIREPISYMHTGPTSHISIFGKKIHNGITSSIFIRWELKRSRYPINAMWNRRRRQPGNSNDRYHWDDGRPPLIPYSPSHTCMMLISSKK